MYAPYASQDEFPFGCELLDLKAKQQLRLLLCMP
jgi:hypothetical protein